VLPTGILPQASTPLQSITRQSSRLATLPLSRGLPPPQRYPSVESHALPGIPPPGSSCVLALTLRLDAFLPRQTPRSVSTGRAHGVRPTELDLTGIAAPLGVASPRAIGGFVCRQEPVQDGIATGSISSGSGLPRALRRVSQPPAGAAFAERQCPGSSVVRLAGRRRRISRRRPRFRGLILRPVGTSATGFPRRNRRPGSPGIPPPWGFPHPVPRGTEPGSFLLSKEISSGRPVVHGGIARPPPNETRGRRCPGREESPNSTGQCAG